MSTAPSVQIGRRAGVAEGLWELADVARPVANAADPTEFGSSGRNIVIGPNYRSVDLSLFKNIRLREKMRLQLRWEVFNVFNTPNFQIPQHLLESANQGEFFALAPNTAGREMQFAARFSF